MFKKWYGGRKNATHVAILISDGRSQDRKATRKEARKAKEAGIKIFTIGVGKRADLEELKEIASDPDDYFVFHVGDFKALDSLNYKLPTSTCVGKYNDYIMHLNLLAIFGFYLLRLSKQI